ncbi:MAG: hemolysin family protein [Natronomonas sp.]|jgi:CBS domain containing-hemolysin-like protein|uniref:hemolysin family protein n=1 Tax=Natronomonas sp. TaxID=2184060 RepID=UPI00286FE8BE|nr:hemolysin family protein [Natronomonas sp.]MDR9430116.1 hemolysin family protein [Natronomonas sp.]
MGSLAWNVATVVIQAAPNAGELPVSDTAVVIIGGTVILLLLALSAFFSSSEIAMFSLPPHRVDALVSDNVPGADILEDLKDDPHRLLVTILVGNNIVNIAMSSIATGLLSYYFSQSVAVLSATFGITALVLLFGESAPKSYAVENTESWALRVSRSLKISEYLLLPLIVTFDYLTRQVNRVTGGRAEIESTYVTREEIRDIIETGEREGVLEEDEREMLQRIFRFTNTITKEVMTPRLDMDAVSKDATVDEAIQQCVQSGHTRVPVYDGSLDNILGVVHISDLVRDYVYGEHDGVALEDLIEETLHVPESKNVDELLAEMREQRMHMVVVIDEFGTTEGLVTMEDVTEEIVGEILQAGEEEPIEFVGDNEAIVKGELNIDEVNEALDIDIPEGEEFETIAGFIFNRAGRLVEEGERIEYDGIEIGIEHVENTRIMKARITRTEAYERRERDEEEAEPNETAR